MNRARNPITQSQILCVHSKTVKTLFYFASLVLFAATYNRIYYGVDFSDESQAVGWVASTLRGIKPFVNDLYIQQTAVLPFTPLFYLYERIAGSEGIVLFGRHVYILLALLPSFCVYKFAKKFMSPPFAVLAAATTFSFIPFAFPAAYYNNAVYVYFTAALFTGAAGAMEKSGRKFFWTGILLGLGVFSYPPLVFAIAAFYIGTGAYLKSKNIPLTPFLAKTTLGAFTPCFAGGLLLLSFGIENLKESLLFSQHISQPFGAGKFITIAEQYGKYIFPFFKEFAGLILLGCVCHAFRLLCFPWIFILFPLVVGAKDDFYFAGSHILIVYYFTIAAPLLLFWSLKKSCHTELANIVLVSLIGGITMALTSTNGLPNLAIGAYPGVIASIIFFAMLIKNSKTGFRFLGKQAGIFASVICLSFGADMVYQNYSFVYRDDNIAALDTRVESGPFAGLITTEQRADFIRQIEKDINDFSGRVESVLFYYFFPAGYLFSELIPKGKILFAQPFIMQKMLYNFYSREENLPDIVFEFYGAQFSSGEIELFNPPDDNRADFQNFLNETRKKGMKIHKRHNYYSRDGFRHFFAERNDYKIVRKRLLYRILIREKAAAINP